MNSAKCRHGNKLQNFIYCQMTLPLHFCIKILLLKHILYLYVVKTSWFTILIVLYICNYLVNNFKVNVCFILTVVTRNVAEILCFDFYLFFNILTDVDMF